MMASNSLLSSFFSVEEVVVPPGLTDSPGEDARSMLCSISSSVDFLENALVSLAFELFNICLPRLF